MASGSNTASRRELGATVLGEFRLAPALGRTLLRTLTLWPQFPHLLSFGAHTRTRLTGTWLYSAVGHVARVTYPIPFSQAPLKQVLAPPREE